MKHSSMLILLVFASLFSACAQKQSAQNDLAVLPPLIKDPAQYNQLEAHEAKVILHQGTERAFTGAYYNKKDKGTYICRQCNNPLLRSTDKFDSGTGWPSFDDAIDGNVKEVPDADGYRVEIVCANCGGHLGHVFTGEGFSDKNTRHCANSASLLFVKEEKE